MADQLEGRNPVVECLARGRRRVHRIWLDEGARPDPRVQRILELASAGKVPVERVSRRVLDEMSAGRVHNGVIARADPIQRWTAKGLVDSLDFGRDPFLVMVDELSYEHNLGAVLRSALGFGVDGMFLPTRRGSDISPVVQRVAMGAAEEVPVVREGLFSALKPIKKAGIRVIGADMGGVPAHELDLSGPLTLVLGGEGRGLPDGLRQRCDAIVSIPLQGGLESLNVSVAAAILMYEKRRQDGWFDTSGS